MTAGAINLELIERLEAPLALDASRLSRLKQSAQEHRSGWLVPMLWDEIHSLFVRASELHSGATTARWLVQVAGDMLGGTGSRTYLIVLMNNAELRDAG